MTALPVRELGTAVAFYTTVLGFSLLRRDTTTATLGRNTVQIGLVVEPAHDPARAGSLAFEVDDLQAMHRELQRLDAAPGAFGIDEWSGQLHRTFFLREPENGYCYCFYEPV